jgi:hypothetical protein
LDDALESFLLQQEFLLLKKAHSLKERTDARFLERLGLATLRMQRLSMFACIGTSSEDLPKAVSDKAGALKGPPEKGKTSTRGDLSALLNKMDSQMK